MGETGLRYKVISERSLAASVRPNDSSRFRVDLVRQRTTIFSNVIAAYQDHSKIFLNINKKNINGKECHTYRDYTDHLISRTITAYLKRRHRVRVASRDAVVKGVVEALLDGSSMYVIRKDIKSFYESIPLEEIKKKVLGDKRTPLKIRNLFQQFFDKHCESNELGLPRGVGLSAILAEIFMQEFDYNVRKIEGVYQYFRFSDDILLFTHLDGQKISQELEDFIPVSMNFNRKKGKDKVLKIGNISEACLEDFEYLGYKFSFERAAKNKSRKVIVSIGDRKIRRIKSRIITALKRFQKEKDFDLLLSRMEYLSGNYMVRRKEAKLKNATHIKSGIFYNYKLAGEYQLRFGTTLEKQAPTLTELKQIDGFYHSLLFGAGSEFRTAIGKNLSSGQINDLKKISFLRGFEKRMLVRMPPYRISEIKGIWRNV